MGNFGTVVKSAPYHGNTPSNEGLAVADPAMRHTYDVEFLSVGLRGSLGNNHHTAYLKPEEFSNGIRLVVAESYLVGGTDLRRQSIPAES